MVVGWTGANRGGLVLFYWLVSPGKSGNYPADVPHDSGTSADGPAHVEIDVTPEMIEAGTLVLLSTNENFEQPEDRVRKIYVAMVSSMAR